MNRRSLAELGEPVSALLCARGCERLAGEAYCWESKLNRVCLGVPEGLSFHFSCTVTRQHYELSPEGDRVLMPRQPPLSLEADASPERIASIIETELDNPF